VSLLNHHEKTTPRGVNQSKNPRKPPTKKPHLLLTQNFLSLIQYRFSFPHPQERPFMTVDFD